MTWKLTILDDAGNEIGWVREDPDDYWIDQAVSDADELEKYLGQRDLVERGGGDSWYNDDGIYRRQTEETITEITDFEQELDELGTYLVYDFDSPADYELTDE